MDNEVKTYNTRMHKNSLTAFEGILPTLSKSRRRVMSAIVEHPGATRQSIAEYMGVPINSVTGRVRELMDMEYITESGSILVDRRQRAKLYPVLPNPEQAELFAGGSA